MAPPIYSLFPRAFGLNESSVTLSADGRYLAYSSFMDGTRQANVFIYDTLSGSIRIVSAGPGSAARQR